MDLGWTVFVFVVYVLAVMRVTRLINYDTILDPIRLTIDKALGDGNGLLKFLGCPWCVGMWASLVTAILPVIVVDRPWWWFLPVALATSMLVGLLAPLSADPIEIEG